jgi:hypothetical protein
MKMIIRVYFSRVYGISWWLVGNAIFLNNTIRIYVSSLNEIDFSIIAAQL